MNKDVNCINFKGLFGYIESNFGKKALQTLVDEAIGDKTYLIENKNDPDLIETVSLKHLTDNSYWVPFELSSSILSMIKTVVPGPDPEQKAGREVIIQNLSGTDLFFSKVLGIKALIKRAAKVNRIFNRSKEVMVSTLEDNYAHIELHYKPEFKVTKEICAWNLGIYEGLGIISGARSVKVSEVKCTVDDDAFCEIRIEWQASTLFNRIYRYILGLLAKDLISGYEQTVDERDKLINRLSSSEEKYRQLIENQSDLVLKIDKSGRFQFASPSFCKMLGKQESELLGEKLLPYVHGEDKGPTVEELKNVFSPPHGARIYNRLDTIDGYRWFSWQTTALMDDKGEVIGITAVGRDVTDKKKTEKALKKSEMLFKLITDNTSAFVSILDPDGNYMFVSQSHKRLGYKPEDLIGESGFGKIVEGDVAGLIEKLDMASRGEILKTYGDIGLKGKNGEIHQLHCSFDGVFRSDGSLESVVCIGEDISELKKVQAQKEQAQSEAAEAKKLALVGQIAGKMAHDFNNMLSNIMGISELALMDCKDENINEMLALILNQTLRGKNLTRNLVAFAKSQEPSQSFFNINDAINLVLDLMKRDLENIELTTDFDPNIPKLLADPGMIEHALVNLIQNSIHALSKVTDPKISIRTYCEDSKIYFEVKDNGCGIPKEYLQNIYEPSFTLKGSKDILRCYDPEIKGTGYGMANVKKYIEQHKGTILVESVVDSGTTSTISLPLIEKELSTDEKQEIRAEIVHNEKYGLIVEDEQTIAEVQYRVLTQDPCNHKVDIANSGEVAMDLINKNTYEFISLDYLLIGDINGMDVYKHIREKNREVPILFVSGNIEFLESIEELKQKDRYVDHLSKPCRNVDYVSRLNLLINRVENRP
jgi:PAS domain S-box-containing protein